MAFGIEEFRSKVNTYGLSRDNLFVVTINGPAIGAEFPEGDLRFFCRSVTVPGIAAQTLEYQNQGHGHAEKRVTGMQFDDLQVIFMVDSGFKVQQYFHRWVQATVNYDNRSYYREHRGMQPFEVAYKDSFAGTVTVDVYGYGSLEAKPSYTFKFLNAYPITTGSTELAWENNDQILTLPVAFTFTTFVPTLGVGVSDPAEPRALSSTLGAGKSPRTLADNLRTLGGFLDVLGVDNPIQDIVDKFTSVATVARRLF